MVNKVVMDFADQYSGGKALIVLGGLSAQGWKDVKDEINPHTILGANGTCFEIPDLDFHMIAENMHMAAGRAARGDKRYKQMMGIFTTKHQAKTRLISELSWDLLKDKSNCVKIRRWGEADPDGYDWQIEQFDPRKYGVGYLHGRMVQYQGALKPKVRFRVGTVAAHLLHHAGILGVKEVHTIGFDLCFKDEQRHHWYKYPKYQVDKFRQPAMFTEYGGLKTQHDWLEGAIWLVEEINPIFKAAGLTWVDHSDGLLQKVGL